VRRLVAEAEEHRPAPVSAQVSDSQIEQAVQRVLAAMTDQTVRRTVVDVAEQLVREELERIKSAD